MTLKELFLVVFLFAIFFASRISLPYELNLHPMFLEVLIMMLGGLLLELNLLPNEMSAFWVVSPLLCVVLPLLLLRCLKGERAEKVMLGLVLAPTVLSIVWFTMGISDFGQGLRYQGPRKVLLGFVINVVFLTRLYVLYRYFRRYQTETLRLGFVAGLSCWNYLAAFPWLGETP